MQMNYFPVRTSFKQNLSRNEKIFYNCDLVLFQVVYINCLSNRLL